MEENSSPTPQSPLQQQHKEFFIIGSLFTLLGLLTVAGILYFQNNAAAIVQQTPEILGEPQGGQAAGLSYSKNKDYVYVGNKIISGADSATFEFLPGTKESWGVSQQFAKDKNHVYDIYLGGLVIQNADVSTFKQLNYMYAEDRNYVYSRNWSVSDSEYGIIVGADPATFEVSSTTNSFDAQDKNHIYLQGGIIDAATLGFVDQKELLAQFDFKFVASSSSWILPHASKEILPTLKEDDCFVQNRKDFCTNLQMKGTRYDYVWLANSAIPEPDWRKLQTTYDTYLKNLGFKRIWTIDKSSEGLVYQKINGDKTQVVLVQIGPAFANDDADVAFTLFVSDPFDAN